jgi:hypothetical protein
MWPCQGGRGALCEKDFSSHTPALNSKLIVCLRLGPYMAPSHLDPDPLSLWLCRMYRAFA